MSALWFRDTRRVEHEWPENARDRSISNGEPVDIAVAPSPCSPFSQVNLDFRRRAKAGDQAIRMWGPLDTKLSGDRRGGGSRARWPDRPDHELGMVSANTTRLTTV